MGTFKKRLLEWLSGDKPNHPAPFSSRATEKFLTNLRIPQTIIDEALMDKMEDRTVSNVRAFFGVEPKGDWGPIDRKVDQAVIVIYIGICRVFNLDPSICTRVNELDSWMTHQIKRYLVDDPENTHMLINARKWFNTSLDYFKTTLQYSVTEKGMENEGRLLILNDLTCIYATTLRDIHFGGRDPKLNFPQIAIYGDHFVTMAQLFLNREESLYQKQADLVADVKARSRYDKPGQPLPFSSYPPNKVQ